MTEEPTLAEQPNPDEQPTPDAPVSEDAVPGRFRRQWGRISHVYRTRVRTTTVLLVIAFIGGMILYLFTANHYGTIPAPPQNRQVPVQTSEYQPEPEPETSVPSTEPSGSSPEGTPSEDEETSPSEESTQPLWPGRGRTEAPTSPPATGDLGQAPQSNDPVPAR